jgi:hypothetical protein
MEMMLPAKLPEYQFVGKIKRNSPFRVWHSNAMHLPNQRFDSADTMKGASPNNLASVWKTFSS